jgi:hypothetical protein
MLYLSEILLQHHELVSFEELIPLVKEGAQRGENWEDRLEAAFTAALNTRQHT